MMTATAGTMAARGYWFNVNEWRLHPAQSEGEKLPGAAGEKYVHVPLVVAFAAAPILGAAFVVFLPVIGFYVALQATGRAVARIAKHSSREVAATVSPGWQPGTAHLTGTHAEGEPAGEKTEAAPEIEKLEEEIAERRRK